jgi:ADP-ribosylglycohydrolase
LQIDISDHLNSISINTNEIKWFDRLLNGNIYELTEKEIFSSGYVLHTFEASIWCLLTSNNYKDATHQTVWWSL